eukprot:m.447292 g.447292  ORF g.447292 m.447292 type:complete len:324 (+) comp19500_c0_seq1:114-1085(+)
MESRGMALILWASVVLVACTSHVSGNEVVVAPRHHKCRDVEPGSKTDPVNQCTACFMETLMSRQMISSSGSDLVIGANDGISFDPAWYFGYWQKVSQHTITWVEPNPTLFKRLSKNTANISNKVLLNRAVRPASMADTELTLFCWNLTMIEAVLAGKMERPWDARLGEVKPHWTALCSLSLPSVVEASDLQKGLEFKALPEAERNALVKDIQDRWIIKHTVPALLPEELAAEAGITELRYLQIDVEGLDNEVVKSLPLGKPSFSPEVILFENHQGFNVKPFLESKGYYVCCCLRQWGSNIVAVKANSSLPSLAALSTTSAIQA